MGALKNRVKSGSSAYQTGATSYHKNSKNPLPSALRTTKGFCVEARRAAQCAPHSPLVYLFATP